MRFVGVAFVVSILSACSGGSSGSEFGNDPISRGDDRGSGASGTLPAPRDGGQAPPSDGIIGVDDTTIITVSNDWCGRPAGRCLDAQSFTVDFVASTLTQTTCVEVGDDETTENAVASKSLTSSQLATIRGRLAAVRLGTLPPNSLEDGGVTNPKKTLDVTTIKNRMMYTAQGICVPTWMDPNGHITAGWQELFEELRAL